MTKLFFDVHSSTYSVYLYWFDYRYSAKDINLDFWETKCDHKKDKNNLKCCEVPIRVLRKAKSIVYEVPDKKEQDIRIANLIDVKIPARKVKAYKTLNKNKRKLSIEYHIRVCVKLL